jgi:hypothetical protein
VSAPLTLRTTDHTFAVTVTAGADATMIRALTTVLAERARGWPFVVIDLCDVRVGAPGLTADSAQDGARGSSTSTQAPSSGGPLVAVTVPPRA